ncbi:MAG: T9SS type A sorting domain-containing protein [Sphingobacteriaceae bacterium]|nr:T9SS type A sorting domain-containing protein [Sphingobacteriaceae bacterium]
MYINSSSEIFLSGNYAQSVDFDPSASTNTLTSPPTYVNVFMSKYNSSGALQLVKGIGDVAGGSVLETVQNIIRDGSGNVYITGYFQGSVDFDPSASTQTLTSVGSNDIFLAKYNSAGSLVWAKSMGGAGADLGIALKIDASNNIILTGHFNSTDCDFDPSASTNSLATNGLYDVFIAKYDNNGNYLNAINVGGTGDDKSFSIALDGSNNIYIAGSMNATVDFDPSASTVNLTSAGSTDGYFAKYSNSLAYVTAGLIGGTSSDQVSGIEVNSTNEIIVGGQYQGTADFDPTAATQNITAANGIDAFFAKYTNAGAYVFAKSIGGTSSDQCADMTIDAAGNIIMTGIYSNTNADFDPSAALANITNYGNSDVYIAKYDGNGNYLFAKSISGSAADFVNTVVTDASGNIYVTGSFNGTADFDSGSATVNKTSNGNADTYIAKFDGNGNLIHAHNMGGVSVDVGYSIATDGAGTIYYTGTFNGLVDFDPLSTVSTLLGSNSQDVFVAKYTECTAVTTTLTAQTNPLCNSLSNGSATVLASGGSGFTYTWTPTGGNSTVAVNLAAGNYSFVAENSCGSKYTHTLTITQPPAIALNANTSSTQVCTPNSVTLTANATGGTGAFTYTWTNISTNSVAVITPTASADYTVVVLDANNCSATTTVNVIALSGPTVTANSSNSIICSGTSVTLTANGATSYTWSTSSNSNSIVVSPTVNTTYTVDGTSANGCSNSAVITQSVTVCNGINSALLNNRVISIYPNPTNGEFTLTLDNYNEKLEAKIYNNIGQLVKTVKVDGLMIKADIADLNNGIFFIRIHDADNAYEYGNFKLIKE